ncbi:hypothetical protein R4514_12500 [Acinetobacter baumannii]|nr:hypothetical protein [Acinetobacter baumannii]
MGLKIRGNLHYILLILSIFFIWIYFPLIFSFLMNWMGWIGTDLKGFSEFGAIGDIYGSLNTLISSLALCAVAYSTILQVNELKLARQTYVDQLNEAKYSNFTALFYSLIQHKQQIFNNIKVKKKTNGEIALANQLFAELSSEFIRYCSVLDGNSNGEMNDLDIKDIRTYFYKLLQRDYFGSFYSDLLTYFNSYTNILNLIAKADLKQEDREFFISMIRDGITINEQTVLIWVSSFEENIKEPLKNSRIIKSNFQRPIYQYIKKFHEPNLFLDENLIERLRKDKL